MWKLAFVLGAAALFASTIAESSELAAPEYNATTRPTDEPNANSSQLVIAILESNQVDQEVAKSTQVVIPENDTMAHQVDQVPMESTTPEDNEITLQVNGVTEELFEPSTPKDNAMTWQIDQTIEMVNNRSVEVFEKVINLGPQDVKAKVALTSPYKEKIGTHIQTLKSYVDGIMLSGTIENSNEKICRKAFDDYAVSLVGNTLTKIENAFLEAFYDMANRFGNFSTQAKKTKIHLTRLRDQASTLTDDTSMDETIRKIYNSFHSSTEEFLQFFMETASGTSIIEKFRPIWDYNINTLGLQVIEKTYDCVFGL